MDLRRHLLHQPQPAPIVLERVVGVDAALHADLGRAVVDRLLNPGLEIVGGDVVGVGRAAALAEAAEGAADDADVGEVDVAVDHEGHPLAGELGAQLVGRHAHLLDHLRPRLREQAGQLLLAQRLPPAPLLDRPGSHVRRDHSLGTAPRALARDEAPVLELDQVEHALLHPIGIQVLGIGAQPLGQRVALRLKSLPDLMRAREGLLGGDVVAVGRQAAEIGGALPPPARPTSPRGSAEPGCRPRASAGGTRESGASCRRA